MTTFRSAVVEDLGSIRRKLDSAVSRFDDAAGRPPSNRELMDARNLSSRLTPIFESLEMGPAPAPGPTTSYRTHRADLLSRLQGFVADRNVRRVNLHNLSRLDDNAMNQIEREIIGGAKKTAADPTQGSFSDPNRLREVKETDQAGRTWTTFKGPVSEFLAPFQFSSQRVVTAIVNPRTGQRLA
jgi:hypothetical protein